MKLFAKKREESTFKGAGELKTLKMHGYTLMYRINVYVRYAIFFEKSQIKISHFFLAPQKLFLLIVLKNDFTSYRDAFFKGINKNNLCGQENFFISFICDFFLKRNESTFKGVGELKTLKMYGSGILMYRINVYLGYAIFSKNHR